MSDIIFKTTFASGSLESDNSPQSSSDIPVPTPIQRNPTSGIQDPQWSSAGSFASFVCHVAFLEKRNRADDSIFFDADSEVFGPRRLLGQGASFRVERSEWRKRDPSKPLSNIEKKRGKYVALKGVLPRQRADWRDVLLEIRALLHEPLRYHPNIARLLGLGWDATSDSGSTHPLLVMEYADLGSMRSLQEHKSGLPCIVKQKLCYDVAKGLSILHACGIIHGDLKHENVLVFQNNETEIPYTAKLADFGGSVMDMSEDSAHSLRMRTWPYNPPESTYNLSVGGVKQTDVYSFGLLVWRAMIDGQNILEIPELKGRSIEEVEAVKLNDQLGAIAEKSIRSRASALSLSEKEVNLIFYVLDNTIQAISASRSLAKASAALKGQELHTIEDFLRDVERRNEEWREADRNEKPGQHGITKDSLGYFLGKTGKDYDAQDDCPGYRPELDHPEFGEFLFDPQRLKAILDWEQQKQIVADLERAAATQPKNPAVDLQPWMAAYYLFQCYLTEFGVLSDPRKACHWLAQAAAPEDVGAIRYNAQAWLWRVQKAYGIPTTMSPDELRESLGVSIIRGHRTCIEDCETNIRDSYPQAQSVIEAWRQELFQSTRCLHALCGAVGMPYFIPRKLRQDYDLHRLDVLDHQIEQELGTDYAASLSNGLPWDVKAESDAVGRRTFNEIYVNHRGHGLLHYAASMGNLQALKHLIIKYKADINLPNQSCSESPLLCACIGGHLDCAIFLLECGANPSGDKFGVETPMHWLCSFQDDDMSVIAKRLEAAGAFIECSSVPQRADIRNVWADWEEMYSIYVTPLGRAVIMNSLPAVKTLLKLDADPLATPKVGETGDHRTKSAIELACVLTRPHILEGFLLCLNARPGPKPRIFDEFEMLQAAHSKSITPFDTTALQSRLVRSGTNYKQDMYLTLQMLQKREQKLKSWQDSNEARVGGRLLCEEIRLGHTDIVETLLRLGHSANGSPEYRPIVEAVKLNHETIFRLLIDHGADVSISTAQVNGDQPSLLQISAGRPRTSRPGLYIADYLLRDGGGIDAVRDGTRSAFALAVKNQDFELADLLLEHGADINWTYQLTVGGDRITILAELVQHHSEKNLTSIAYLLSKLTVSQRDSKSVLPFDGDFSKPNEAGGQSISLSIAQQPDFIVNKTSNLSVLQVLASCSRAVQNSNGQVTGRITQMILKAFGSADEINYCHPRLGTALCQASFAGNFDMVSGLVASKADKNLATDPGIFSSIMSNTIDGVIPAGSPLWLVLCRLQVDSTLETKREMLPQLKSIVELLLGGESLDHERLNEVVRQLRLLMIKMGNNTDNQAEEEVLEASIFTEILRGSQYLKKQETKTDPQIDAQVNAKANLPAQYLQKKETKPDAQIDAQVDAKANVPAQYLKKEETEPDAQVDTQQVDMLAHAKIDTQVDSLPNQQATISILAETQANDLSRVSSQSSSSTEENDLSLPLGWEMQTTHEGRAYYIDHNNKTTTWERPTYGISSHDLSSSDESVRGVNKSLPPGWEIRISRHDGRLYYVDHNTKTTSWLRPNSSKISTTTTNPLPQGWERRRTKDGRTYYVDHNTQSTQWTFSKAQAGRKKDGGGDEAVEGDNGKGEVEEESSEEDSEKENGGEGKLNEAKGEAM